MALLLRTLIEDPLLAAQVESINVDNPTLTVTGHSLPQSDLPLVRSMLQRSEMPQPETWEDAIIRAHNFDIVLGLLVAQCNGIHSLKITLGPQANTKWLQEVFRHAVMSSGSSANVVQFNALKDITIRTSFEGVLPPDLFSLLLYLPQLTSLDASLHVSKTNRSWAYGPLEWPFSKPPVAKCLTTLRLFEAEVTAEALGIILALTPALITLEYKTLIPSSRTPINCTTLQGALSNVATSLENLEVRHEAYADEACDVTSLSSLCTGRVGPLRDMTALTSLNISLTHLLGQHNNNSTPRLADVLPPNLKRLTINDDFWDYDRCEWADRRSMAVFKLFLEGNWRTATPCLEALELDLLINGNFSYDYWLTTGKEELCTMANSQGLKCTVLFNEEDLVG